jgi:hypothetical protein
MSKVHWRIVDFVENNGFSMDKLQYDYSELHTTAKDIECCPCGEEIEITLDGKTTCPVCGLKEVAPCARCPHTEIGICDWQENVGCSPFPKTQQKEKIRCYK